MATPEHTFLTAGLVFHNKRGRPSTPTTTPTSDRPDLLSPALAQQQSPFNVLFICILALFIKPLLQPI
jgi:hypothetical protein